MPLHPLTPSVEDPHEAIDTENGATLDIETFPHAIHREISLAMSSNAASAGDSDAETKLAQQSVSDESDEDQYMSEGGIALTMTPSHAAQLNAEMDMVDVEVMGPANLLAFFNNNLIHSNTAIDPLNYPFAGPQNFEEDLHAASTEGAVDNTSLPAAMSEVSQQLQHLQDGQEHPPADASDDGFAHHSTSPSPLHDVSANSPVSAVSVSIEAGPQVNSSQLTSGLAATEEWHIMAFQVSPVELYSASSAPFILWEDDMNSDADDFEVEEQGNLHLGEFLYNWGISSARDEESRRRPVRGPRLPAIHQQRYASNLDPVHVRDLRGDICDFQRINWSDMGVSRADAIKMRRQTYRNYTTLRPPRQFHVCDISQIQSEANANSYQSRMNLLRLPDDDNLFRFRRMDFNQKVNLSHFQLRNLIASPSRDHIFYAGRSQILQFNPLTNNPSPSVAMDLRNPEIQPFHSYPGGVLISTLTAKHDILVAGGFCGEYGLINLRAHKDARHTEGLITDDQNSITNHIQVHLPRNSSLPVATFASNDNFVRILDVNTNKFISEHKYDQATNCTAISPDRRLRVLVGDTRNVMICNAETGEILQELEGHTDYGFACDWSENGWAVATGNQDMQIKIWDARCWKRPVNTIAAEMAGVRTLKFSPLGSGRNVLVAAEPADFVNVIDAETFESKQTLNFFGEIGGVDFTNDGQDLIVANCDTMRGGIMEFERCDVAGDALYGLRRHPPREEFSHPTRAARHRERQGVRLGSMTPF
ncbi:hypothetical protein B7494_g8634 [Chlorociboria aeruginascens]|nr:hypothetical protein B7494_g8634 [Chlorociboria aeruginascens]